MNEPLMVAAENSTSNKDDETNRNEIGVTLLGSDSNIGSSADPISIESEQLETVANAGDTLSNPLSDSHLRLPSNSTKSLLVNSSIASEPISRVSKNLAPDVPVLQLDATASTSTDLREYQETLSFIDFFDFRFRRYLTPGIVRISWFLILLACALWILLLSYFYVSSLLHRHHFTLPDVRIGSNLASEPVSDPSVFTIPQFFYNSALYFTYLIVAMIGLLWTRVAFETIIMVFSIGSYLREQKSGRGKKK
jgi:hypothetical protein